MPNDGDAPQIGAPATSPASPAMTALSGANARFVEAQLARYSKDPASVGEDWRQFFDAHGERGAPQGPSWARQDWPL
ncbi:MAG TPA: hypothetical protein DEA50_05415, partial [Parvularcula sp.]|nr:hypothetical protein [Parvularcula sp.]